MKTKRILAAGIMLGVLLCMGIQTFASDTVKHITASVNDTFQFIVDGAKADLPEEYEVLIYNNRTYLPVRAVGDMVGTKVDWDNRTKTITLTSSSKSSEENPPRKEYEKLPVTKENKEFTLTITTCTEDLQDHYRKLGLRLESRQKNTTVRIAPSATKYIIEGVSYDYSQTESSYWDDRWYTSYAEKGRDLEGYLILPKEAQNARDIHLEVTVWKDTDDCPIPFITEFDLSV